MPSSSRWRVAGCRPALADEAHFWFPTQLAAQVESGVRSGLVIGIERDGTGALVTVSSEIRPLGRAPRLAPGHPEATGDLTSLALPTDFVPPKEVAEIGRAGLDVWETTLRVVEYVSARIALDEADRGAQDVASVLARGRARCSGRANAAVGLLRAVGVPARVVRCGGGRAGGAVAPVGRSVAGEARLIPFDPASRSGVVGALHPDARGGEARA